MNHPTREILINCGMIPVSAVSMDGSVTQGYWHHISCSSGECYTANQDGNYSLKEYPILHKDGGAAYLKNNKTGKVAVVL